METKIVEKWEKSGFLTSDMNKENVALACELTELHISKIDNNTKDDLKTLIFPVIVRIFRKQKENLTMENITEQVNKIIKDFSNSLTLVDKTDWIPVVGNDPEANFVADFCENYEI
jgi:hypothetical protein